MVSALPQVQSCQRKKKAIHFGGKYDKIIILLIVEILYMSNRNEKLRSILHKTSRVILLKRQVVLVTKLHLTKAKSVYLFLNYKMRVINRRHRGQQHLPPT